MRAPLAVCLAVAFAFVAFSACGPKKPPVEPEPTETEEDSGPPPEAAPEPSLYDRLGGKDGVAGIVDSFVENLKTDKVVSRHFPKGKGKLDHFKQMFAEQICQVCGGPCQYSGKNMKDAHKGMGLTDAQFAAFLQDLKLALEEKQVGDADVKALMAKLGAMQDDVVEKKGKK